MKAQAEQGRSGKKALGVRKMKRGLGFKLQVVYSPGAFWKNKSVEEIVAMLSTKTKFLGKQVVCLLRKK